MALVLSGTQLTAQVGAGTDMSRLMTGMIAGSLVLLGAVAVIVVTAITMFVRHERSRREEERAAPGSSAGG